MSDWQLKTPVAFIIFNRPDTTGRVFREIAKARPQKLLVVADGAREGKSGEAERVAQTRAIVQQVDWPCEVLTNFSDVNLGCKRRVSSGIDWVFEQVDRAIILEDDCLPDASFFTFCSELLEKYADDEQVKIISGTNYLFGESDDRNSYFFSPFMPIWGWATWRRAWREVDYSLSAYDRADFFKSLSHTYRDDLFCNWLMGMVDQTVNGCLNSWDLYPVIRYIYNGGVGISPYRNLISNIGEQSSRTDGVEAKTHSRRSSLAMPVVSVDMSTMVHPMLVEIDRSSLDLTVRGVNSVVYGSFGARCFARGMLMIKSVFRLIAGS